MSSPARPAAPLALITGASRGIGLAIAEALAPEFRLRLVARPGARLEEAIAGLRTKYPELDVEAWPADLALAGERGALAEKVATAGVDVLVNNAGIAPSGPVQHTDDAAWAEVMAINLTAPFELMRAALPHMKRQGWGRVINVASTAGLKGYRYTAAYCASKHGLVGLTRGAALDLAASGITVNALCPGFTETDMARSAVDNIVAKTGRSSEQAHAALASLNPQGRLIAPGEVAALAAYLCSEAAAGVHGQALAIDGGETA